jgi:23S rRNA (adenine2503-C2)-methyltransferase
VKNLLGLTQAELAEELKAFPDPKLREGEDDRRARRARVRAKQIYAWVYQRGVRSFDEMTDIAQDLRAWLSQNFDLLALQPRVEPSLSEDGTTKFLWALADGKTVESVLIPANGRLTGCISSQVGCAMACKFCLTGIQGLDRSLSAAEIVAQVVALRRVAPVTNIVFMGMGEPLHNLENVIAACRVLTDQEGLGFSKRKVTVSTSGLVPAIEELGKATDVSLAISLNATTDEVRDEIMPVNKKWNIAKLMETCRNYPLGSHR